MLAFGAATALFLLHPSKAVCAPPSPRIQPQIMETSKEDEDDNDYGMTRSLTIEEAWLENAVYLNTSWENSLQAGHQANVSGEADFAFNSRLGGEFDFPAVLMQEPLGRGPSALGPIALGLRGAVFQAGDKQSRNAGILSLEAEGSIWPHDIRSSAFSGPSSSFTSEALAGFRQGPNFIQGIYGYTTGLDNAAAGGWFANTSIGRRMTSQWIFQIEGDAAGTASTEEDAANVTGTLIPEIAYKGKSWMAEIGEGFMIKTNSTPTTYFLFEWDL